MILAAPYDLALEAIVVVAAVLAVFPSGASASVVIPFRRPSANIGCCVYTSGLGP
jgi:hypothetical protein